MRRQQSDKLKTDTCIILVRGKKQNICSFYAFWEFDSKHSPGFQSKEAEIFRLDQAERPQTWKQANQIVDSQRDTRHETYASHFKLTERKRIISIWWCLWNRTEGNSTRSSSRRNIAWTSLLWFWEADSREELEDLGERRCRETIHHGLVLQFECVEKNKTL